MRIVALPAALLAGVLAVGRPALADISSPSEPATKTTVDSDLRAATTRVVGALARRDYAALSRKVDSDGVWITNGRALASNPTIRYRPAELRRAASSPTRRRWGYTGAGGCDSDGCPEFDRPRTLREYFDYVVYARDFGRHTATFSPVDEWNGTVAGADAWEVTFRDPGPPDSDLDWRILQLYFHKRGGRWVLVAIHNREWLI